MKDEQRGKSHSSGETDLTTGSWAPVITRSLQAIVVLGLVTSGMMLVRPKLEKAHVAMLYVVAVLSVSALGSRILGVATAALAFLLFNYFFLPPYNSFFIDNPLDWLVLLTFLITSVVAAELLDRQRRQAQLAELRRSELDQLAGLGAETLNAARAEYALAAIASVIKTALGVARCELFVRTQQRGLVLIADSAMSVTWNRNEASHADISDSEGLLQYITETGRAAILQADDTVRVIDEPLTENHGWNSAIVGARAFAIPLTVRGGIVGALRVSDGDLFSLSAERYRTLVALAYYAALGIDRLRLEEAEEATEQLRQVDKLKDALLAAVSHDLRTPLTNIKAIAHEIRTGDSGRAVIIEEEVDRLAKLVDGLLELSALNAGAVALKLELNTVDELVGAALDRADAALGQHSIETNFEEWEELIGRFDFASSLRILTNLLENAAKYSPAHSAIRVSAVRIGDRLEISVSDRGAGIAESERGRIFEPFYRVPGAMADVRGAGLGLSIAQKLAAAQGGRIEVCARHGGGSVFTLVLRANEMERRPES